MPDETDILERVRALLNERKPQQALAAVSPHLRSGSDLLLNAYAVCLMRLGQHDRAAGTLRTLVYEGSNRRIRPSASADMKVNFATALLLSSNIKECEVVLQGIGGEGIPATKGLEDTISEWRRGLSWFERLQSLWIEPKKPVVVDFPPGVL